ncbi:MAG: MFS transporter, partial [Pseudonocardia sp.]|nr:MFS transporter [Pseudonocardia sp.]
AWGWRIPFLLSIVLVAVGLQVRRTLSETEEFDQVKQARAREQSPVIESLRRPRNVIAIFLMRVGQNTTFYIVSVFVLSYATSALKLSKPTILAATVVGAVAACVLCPLYGHLGDRFGFRWVMLASLLSQAVFAFPFFLLLDSRNVAAVVIAVTIGIGGGSAAADAIQAGYFTSMFGTRIRFSAVSIGREGGTVVGGGFAPLIAAGLLAWEGGTPWAVAGWMLFTSLVGIAGIFLARPALPSEPASDPRAATAADPAGA